MRNKTIRTTVCLLVAAIFVLCEALSSGGAKAWAATHTLSGTVYGGGNVVEGVTVALLGTGGIVLDSVLTDASGFYSLSVEDGIYMLVARPPDGSVFEEKVINGIVVNGSNVTEDVILVKPAPTPTPTATSIPTVTPTPKPGIHGVVKGLDNQPVQGDVWMTIYDQESGAQVKNVHLSAGGAYDINLVNGTYKIGFEGTCSPGGSAPPSWTLRYAEQNLVVNGGKTHDIQLPFTRLSGKTRNSGGNPVGNVAMELHAVGSEFGEYFSIHYNVGQASSNASADYSLVLLARAGYSLALYPSTGSGLGTTFASGVDATQSATKDFTLASSVMLHGTIRGLEGKPLANTGVRLTHKDSGQELSMTTNASGAYAFDVMKGAYRVDLESFDNVSTAAPLSWGYRPAVADLNLTGEKTQDIQVPMVLMSGKVTDGGGNPVAGVEFSTNHWWLEGVDLSCFVTQEGGHVVSDALGRYSMALLAHPDYPIRLIPPAGLGLGQLMVPDVDASHSATRDFVLSSPLNLHGVVLGLQDKPLAGVRVRLRDPDIQSLIKETTTNQRGEYQFAATKGTYDIELFGDSCGRPYAPRNWNIFPARNNLGVSGDTTCNFQQIFAQVSGKIFDSNGAPVPGAELRATGLWYTDDSTLYNRNDNRWVMSDGSGSYLMALIPHTYSEVVVPPTGSGFSEKVIPDVDISHSMVQNITLDLGDTKAPIIVGGPRAVFIRATYALIEWQTDETANSAIEYGTTDSLGKTVSAAGYLTKHFIIVKGLQPGTAYSARALSSDLSGNGPTKSAILHFRTTSDVDFDDPMIVEGPMITGITDNSLTVDWETDKPTDSFVSYGTSEALQTTVTLAGLVTEHRVTVPDLASATRYYLKVFSTDALGNGPTQSRIITAKTLSGPDTEPPVIVCGPMAVYTSDNSANIVWETSEIATSGVSYNDGTAFSASQDDRLVLRHAVHLAGLKPSTLYSYTVTSKDSSGNGPVVSKTLQFKTRSQTDSQRPVIGEGPIALHISAHTALIRWLTNEPADSAVQFGKTSNLDTTVSRSELVRYHLVPLTNLEAGTAYYFRALSTDRHGNGPTSSTLYSFTTRQNSESGKPCFADGPRVVYKSDRRAIIYWRTDRPTDSVVDYGEGSDRSLRACNPELEIEHLVTLANLKPGASYTFAVSSADLDGNTASSLDTPTLAPGKAGAARMVSAAGSPGAFVANNLGDIDPPVLVGEPEVLAVSANTALIRWGTDEQSDTRVEYGLEGQPFSEFAANETFCSEHVILLTNLAPSTAYSFRVGSQDPSGNGPTFSGNKAFVTSGARDTVPPVVKRTPFVWVPREGLAIVTWDTSEYATSQVFYSLEGASSDPMLSVHTGLRQNHSVALPNLKPGARYRFQCASMDSAGNLVITGVGIFTNTVSETAAANWMLFE